MSSNYNFLFSENETNSWFQKKCIIFNLNFYIKYLIL